MRDVRWTEAPTWVVVSGHKLCVDQPRVYQTTSWIDAAWRTFQPSILETRKSLCQAPSPVCHYVSSLQMTKPSTPLFLYTVNLGTRLRTWQPEITQCNYITMVSQSNYNTSHSGLSPCWYTMLTTPGINLCMGALSTGNNFSHYGGSHGAWLRILLEGNCLRQ